MPGGQRSMGGGPISGPTVEWFITQKKSYFHIDIQKEKCFSYWKFMINV